MNMSMPGFNAESSLYVSKGRYAGAGAPGAAAGHVVPQLMGEAGLANSCWAACRCCRNWGNRFCCSHCRWCSGPIGWGLELSL
jgi:hypothetical protein